MRRALRIGAGLALALVVITCTDQTVTGPKHPGMAVLDLRAWATATPGLPPVPIDSLEIILRRPADQSVALDTKLGFRPDTLKGDSGLVRLDVGLSQTSEAFDVFVRAFGGGIDWYHFTGSVQITAGGAPAQPVLTGLYVGPGANAARVAILPADTTAVGGTAFPLHATAYDAAGAPIPGVPIGYRLSDTTRGKVAYPTPYTATLTAALSIRDSVWVVAETPTHLKDSTRVHLIPQPAQLVKVSGDNQTGVIGGALHAPFLVRVLDALGGGFKGDSVRWSVTAGSATLSSAAGVTDDTGYAQLIATPTALGPLTVQVIAKSIGGAVGGSPATFTALAGSGSVKHVVISPKVDTVAYGATVPYTATLTDSLGNMVTATVLWTSTIQSVATVDPSSGLATSVGGDSTRIIAASGGVADTARLYVRVLRTITLSPADTIITAVGDSVRLRTAAFDNFGVPVTSGLKIRFTSASPSVVTVDTGGTAKIVGPGNGVVLARDSVAPPIVVQGSATLRVNQVTRRIVNAPPDSVLVGASGQSQIVATALDSNGHAIPGKTFAWTTRNSGIATVSGSGLVTGGATLGSTYAVDSLVEPAGVFKDSTRVVVTAAPPKLLQWAFDSTSVGNGGSVSIGLAVTAPPTSPLTVSIASTDTTIAKASPNIVTIGTGSSATSVTIYGLKAGRAVLTATDASGLGYSSKQMVMGVVSTITFREIANPCCQQPYFYLNQNETHKAQVWLSDPAPAGGLGITFVYERGIAAVTPSPAVIPAGQLSADIVLQGLQPGPSGLPDSVVPTSGGYIGKFSYVYVAPDSLRLTLPYPSTGTLGVGQTFQPYVAFQFGMDHPLLVSARLSSALLGTTPDTATIPTGLNYRYFTVAAKAAGSDTLTVSATGWVSASAVLTFTTPRLGVGGSTSMVAGDPSRGYWAVSTLDSLGYGHPVADTVVVTAVSRNTNAVVVDIPTGKIPPGSGGQTVSNSLRALAAAGGDSAWIVLSAPGYRTDSFKVYVTKPTLGLVLSYPGDGRVGIGTRFQGAGYVTIPYPRPDTFTVVFSHSLRASVSGPDSVSIPKGQTYAYFDVIGTALGTDTLAVARATNYVVQGSPQVLRVDPLHVRPYNYPGGLYTISPPQVVSAIVVDSVNGIGRPLVARLLVSLTATNLRTFTLDSTQVVIDSGQVTSHFDTLRVVPGADTTAGGYVRISASGSSPDSTPLIRVQPTPLTVNVPYPNNGQVGRGLKLQGYYVSIPAAAPNTLSVALQRYDPLRDSLSAASVVIPKGSSYSQAFDVFGLDSTGTDSITAAAAGFVTARTTITPVPVSLTAARLGASHLTTEPPQTAYVYPRTRLGFAQNAAAPVTFAIKSTDSTVLRLDSAGAVFRGDSATSTVAAGQTYGYYRVRYVGSGTARLLFSAPSFADDSTELVSVTGPSLHLVYATVTTGLGQIFQGQYVYLDNAVIGNPLVVTLQRSDSTNPGQIFGLSATSVTIPVGSGSSALFDITGQNGGSAQLIARASGYSQATANVTVGQPQLVVSPKTLSAYVGAPPTSVTVSTRDQTGANRIVASAITVGDVSSAPAIAIGDSATVPIATRGYYNSVGVKGLQKGSAAITFSAPGYKSDTVQVSVDTAALSLSPPPTGLGPNQVAQMQVSIPFYTSAPVTVNLSSDKPSVATVPSTVTIPANSYYAYFDLTGVGSGTATISATATGFYAATPVPVSTGTPKLGVGLPSSVVVGMPSTIYIYSLDSLGNNRNVAAPLSVTLTSSSPTHTAFGSGVVTIPAGASSASTTVTFDTAGVYALGASATGYSNASPTTTTATGAFVTMVSSLKFTPPTVTISAGQYVTWKNTDTITHTTTADASSALQWDSGNVAPGATSSVYFPAPGTYTYHCTIHGAIMSGTVIVQ